MLSIVDLQWQNCVVVAKDRETENSMSVEDTVVVFCGEKNRKNRKTTQ